MVHHVSLVPPAAASTQQSQQSNRACDSATTTIALVEPKRAQATVRRGSPTISSYEPIFHLPSSIGSPFHPSEGRRRRRRKQRSQTDDSQPCLPLQKTHSDARKALFSLILHFLDASPRSSSSKQTIVVSPSFGIRVSSRSCCRSMTSLSFANNNNKQPLCSVQPVVFCSINPFSCTRRGEAEEAPRPTDDPSETERCTPNRDSLIHGIIAHTIHVLHCCFSYLYRCYCKTCLLLIIVFRVIGETVFE